ncbi:MAG TPA: permease prefix domain 1-containing protein [Candidatus Krumholzibacteria bacterium]|nr:permease prefix domain 1-containing protein [Candidatus Krumholzibacteria bacterium]
MTSEAALEQRIGEWRTYFRTRQAVHSADVAELEDHLRSQIDALREAGLAEDEAFLVAVKRLGSLDSVSREFAREYSERLWKQLVVAPDAGAAPAAGRSDGMLAVGLAVGAAIAIKVPELFGRRIMGSDTEAFFYLRNVFLLVLPFLAGFFALKRSLHKTGWTWLAFPFIAAALIMNVMPFKIDHQTTILAIIHLPIALWLLTIGLAYIGGEWRNHAQRMNFVRFSGEWFIYFVLTALGGGTLIAFTFFIFNAIGLKPDTVVGEWVVPCGAAGAVLIAAWLVEWKKSVIENMAPVLTMLFTPLFTVLLLVFVATIIVTGNAIDVGREVLIGFDLLLVLVLGLLLYSISARDSHAPPSRSDRLRLALVLSALVVDTLALWAIAERISEFGFSPNKTAALGLNILLLINLGWSAVLYIRFLAKRSSFTVLERWQTSYLPVFGIWAWIVVALFPVIFKYQ